MTYDIPPALLDMRSVEGLVLHELANFSADFEQTPFPRLQYHRSGAIAWLATFSPESFTGRLRGKILEVFLKYRSREDYRTFAWWRLLYLESAMFALTEDRSWLQTMINNIDHDNSTVRSCVHGPLGLIAPKLTLNEYNLLSRMKKNLENGNLYNESMICIYCAIKGTRDEKISLAKEWKITREFSSELIEKIGNKRTISNAFISDDYSEICRYLICMILKERMLSRPAVVDQGDLFRGNSGAPRIAGGQFVEQKDFFQNKTKIARIEDIWSRMRVHPLIHAEVVLA